MPETKNFEQATGTPGVEDSEELWDAELQISNEEAREAARKLLKKSVREPQPTEGQ